MAKRGLLVRIAAALGLDQQLLSPAHWIKIYDSQKNSPYAANRSRIAETCFQAGGWLLAEAVEGPGHPAIARLAWESFARAALIDPGMADAYLVLFMLRAFAPKGVEPLDLLDALRLTSGRLHQEQRRHRFPVHVHYSPLGFTEIEIATQTDCSLAYSTELILLGRLQEAETVLNGLSENEQHSELVQAVRARLAFNLGDLHATDHLLNGVIAGSRLLRADAHWMRGITRMGLEEYAGARADFEIAEAESLDLDCIRSCREALAYVCGELGDSEGEHTWLSKLAASGTLPHYLGGPPPIEDAQDEDGPEEIEAVPGVDYEEVDNSPLVARDGSSGKVSSSTGADDPELLGVDPDVWRQVLRAFDGPPADDPTVR